MILAPTLTVRIGCPFAAPIVLGEWVTFRQLAGPADGYEFAGTVVAITRAPTEVLAIDILLVAA